MVIYFGADHRGFDLKEHLKTFVKGLGYEIDDMGDAVLDPADDYPKFAAAVAAKVSADQAGARGILVCSSGAGMDITANKFKGVRSVLALSADQVYDTRHNDDANVLSIAAEATSPEDAERVTRIFLETPFGGEERHARRLDEIKKIENG